MKRLPVVRSAFLSLLINFAYAAFHWTVGIVQQSWWMVTLGAYYLVLSVTRFSVLLIRRKGEEDFAQRVTGILFLFLSVCLLGVMILSATDSRGKQIHEIVMIAMAAYTFTKLTLAIINLAKAKKTGSPAIRTLRNLSLADATVSIFSLQRSMLVSFPGMTPENIQLFNILTGTATAILVCLLGINLIGGRRVNMAKSKMVEVNRKIAETVTDCYKKVEGTVVGGYKKVEEAVVSGYTKIEDQFVDTYLTKNGESVEEAKARLKKENK